MFAPTGPSAVALAGPGEGASLASAAPYASDLARGVVEVAWLVEVVLAEAEPEEVDG